MIDKHIDKMTPDIQLLKKSNKGNNYVLAIMLTESFFRSKARMVGEVLFWMLCSIFRPKRVPTISIGICQMQIKHWVSLGSFGDEKPSLKNIFKVFDIFENYEVCYAHLSSMDMLKSCSILEISNFYRGRNGRYYYKTLNHCFKRLTLID